MTRQPSGLGGSSGAYVIVTVRRSATVVVVDGAGVVVVGSAVVVVVDVVGAGAAGTVVGVGQPDAAVAGLDEPAIEAVAPTATMSTIARARWRRDARTA